jgi:hypothetical protein
MQEGSMTPRHERALLYARGGIPIFPCIVNGKRPACPNGFKDATTDLDLVSQWWEEADYNLAFEPARMGWFVVDIDPRHGGDVTWERLSKENGLDQVPTIRVVQTPSGGRHLYFAGVIPPTRAGVLGPGLDLRSAGGYVLLPPSVIDGNSYTVIS